MRIAIGSDEDHPTARSVLARLRQQGHTVQTVAGLDGPALSWPRAALGVAQAVASGQADEGILFCWTGTGVSIAANKVRGIRAALCHDAETARGAQLWNDANVLCLPCVAQLRPSPRRSCRPGLPPATSRTPRTTPT